MQTEIRYSPNMTMTELCAWAEQESRKAAAVVSVAIRKMEEAAQHRRPPYEECAYAAATGGWPAEANNDDPRCRSAERYLLSAES